MVEAVRHVRQINREIGMAQAMSSAELYGYAKVLGVPIDLLQKTAQLGRLPVPFFGAGGVGICGEGVYERVYGHVRVRGYGREPREGR